jgi:hypothetical protein
METDLRHVDTYIQDTSSGILRCVLWYKSTDVSKALLASIIRAITCSD